MIQCTLHINQTELQSISNLFVNTFPITSSESKQLIENRHAMIAAVSSGKIISLVYSNLHNKIKNISLFQ